MRKLLSIALGVILAGLLAWTASFGAHVVRAEAEKVPTFTILLCEQAPNADGTVRSDGTWFSLYARNPNGDRYISQWNAMHPELATHVIDYVSKGINVMYDEQRGIRSTTGAGIPHIPAQQTHCSQNEKPDKPIFGFKVMYSSHEIPASPNKEDGNWRYETWYAPELGCEMLQQTVTDLKNNRVVSNTETVYADNKEPNSRLFIVKSGLREVSSVEMLEKQSGKPLDEKRRTIHTNRYAQDKAAREANTK